MTVKHFEVEPGEHLPSAAELAELVAPDRLVLLPDQLVEAGEDRVAGFRPESKALRADALDAGLDVRLVVPVGARPGEYSEHAADWVLPLILSVPGGTIGTLIANELQRRLDAWRTSRKEARTPIARFREIVVDTESGTTRQLEMEGPVDELIDLLRERRPLETSAQATQLSEPDNESARESDP